MPELIASPTKIPVPGNKLVEEGDPFVALLWFVEALRLDLTDSGREEVHRRRIAAILRHAPVLEQNWIHDSAVVAAEFSPDGRFVVSASSDGTARVWEVAQAPLPIPDWLTDLAEAVADSQL